MYEIKVLPLNYPSFYATFKFREGSKDNCIIKHRFYNRFECNNVFYFNKIFTVYPSRNFSYSIVNYNNYLSVPDGEYGYIK